jgi:hypothetical protein
VNASHAPTAEDRAAQLPAPRPGLRLKPMPIDVMAAYLTTHCYEIERVDGGMVTVRPLQTMTDVAKKLSEIGD